MRMEIEMREILRKLPACEIKKEETMACELFAPSVRSRRWRRVGESCPVLAGGGSCYRIRHKLRELSLVG